LNDQILENVTVSLEFDNDELEIEIIVPIQSLVYDQPASCFVCLRKQEGSFPIGFFFFFFFFLQSIDP